MNTTIENPVMNNLKVFDALNKKKNLMGKKDIRSILLIQPVQIATDKDRYCNC